jgi:hypothetical protein
MSPPTSPPILPSAPVPGPPALDAVPTAGEQARYRLILALMVPVFLAAAGNDPDLARRAAINALDECEAVTMAELEAAARAICLDHAAMDSLGRSMAPDLTESQRARYRSQAVALTRTAERARDLLQALRARRLQTAGTRPPPASAAEPPPEPSRLEARLSVPALSDPAPTHVPEPIPWAAELAALPLGLDAMTRANRAMLAEIQSWQAGHGPPQQVPPDAHRSGRNGLPDRRVP